MEVTVLRATEDPERLVCQAARGDYYEGYVGDTKYAELMENVNYAEDDIDPVTEARAMTDEVLEAKTRSLIEKQLKRGHYGPFEHPQITFAVEGVSRVAMAQITRHRHITFDIQSMRYADFSEQEIKTPKSLTDTEHFSREDGALDLSERSQHRFREVYENHIDRSVEAYENMVDAGVPKEDARFILPLGTTVNMTFSGNARTFLHLLDMRRKADAQWEIRELSEALLDELFDWMPTTFEYYRDNGPNKLSP